MRYWKVFLPRVVVVGRTMCFSPWNGLYFFFGGVTAVLADDDEVAAVAAAGPVVAAAAGSLVGIAAIQSRSA